MKRHLYQHLVTWKTHQERTPLLLRGARQVGKTHLIDQFGKQEFAKFHTINFELEPQFQRCFDDLHPHKIIDAISILMNEKIEAGKSLLFLDEIQICPRAIVALRYFKELMPELHVIAAGSLLEFALKDASVSVPVGRIEYLYLKPLSFIEFLMALQQDLLIEKICNYSVNLKVNLPRTFRFGDKNGENLFEKAQCMSYT